MRNAHPVHLPSTRFPRATFPWALLVAGLFFHLIYTTSAHAAEFEFDFYDLLERGKPLEQPHAEPAVPVPPLRTAGDFSRGDAGHLAEAYSVAHDRLRLLPSCRALFAPYGADGEDLLAGSLYVQATTHHEAQICGRRVAAFTAVESPVTRLCRNFRRLDAEQGALILIHEALHFAGMPEAPHEKDAMTSQEINELVAESCGL